VIQLNDQRFWLYAAVDPETNDFLHVRLFPTRTIVLTKQFLAELQEKHDVADAVFSSTAHRGYRLHCSRKISDFSMSPMEIGMLSNVSSKK